MMFSYADSTCPHPAGSGPSPDFHINSAPDFSYSTLNKDILPFYFLKEYGLFLCEDHNSFIEEKKREDERRAEKKLKSKKGRNYDKMLWGHIDWDEMFRNVIAE